jgi:hypothetical protein
VLAFLFLPPILLVQTRERMTVKKIVLADLYFFLPSLLAYFVPGPLYIGHYLPAHYDVSGLVNSNLTNWGPLFQRYSDILTHLIASPFGIHLWGYIYFFAAFFLVAEIFFRGRFSRDARNWLYAMLVLYLGLGALGFVLPLVDLNDTTKRELFKMLPLIVLYLANNAALIRLSQWISRWEGIPDAIGGRLAPAGPPAAVAGRAPAAAGKPPASPPSAKKPTAPPTPAGRQVPNSPSPTGSKPGPGASKKRRRK